MLAPIRQLGLQVALGLRGFPSNRIIMVYGPPSGGKSSLFFQTAGEYIHNGDEVWMRETEHALDRIYMASYLPADLEGANLHKEALEHWKKRTKALIAKNTKAKEDEKFVSPNQMEIMLRRMEEIDTLLKELKEGGETQNSALPLHRHRNLMRNALAEYKLRNISIEHPRTLEDFESQTISDIDAKLADPKRRFKRLLIGVDSLSYLLPKEDVEKAVSSDGRNFGASKYLHTLLPRLLGKISGHEITLMLIIQQTTHIKMNPYESTSQIGAVQGKGGTAIKFGATFMVGVEQRAKTNNTEGDEVKTGMLVIPKAKLRGGGQGPTQGRFYLKEGVENSVLDLNEPMVLDILNQEKIGIVKRRGRHYVPGNLLRTHPSFETAILPKLKPIPKKKGDDDEEGGEETEPTAVEAPAEATAPVDASTPKRTDFEGLFYSGYAVEIMPLLLETPKFQEEILNIFDVVEPV